MPTDMRSLQGTLPGLQQLVEAAESHRDKESLDVLRKYMGLQMGDLLPLTQTLSEGVFAQIIHYLGAGDDAAKIVLRQKYQALWEMFLHENSAGVVGLLLVKEIVLSLIFPFREFSQDRRGFAPNSS